MEVNDKVKELEEEVKVLKAEIRNVLLDIREVILERSNPLGDEHESAFIRMDLNTTARAMAAEAAGREAGKAADEAEHIMDTHEDTVADELTVNPPAEDTIETTPGVDNEIEPATEEQSAGPAPEPEASEPPPKVIKRNPATEPGFDHETPLADVPPMYMANLSPLSGNGSLAQWVAEALETVGPRELERIIAMHRLWGALPPNIGRALAHLQELLHETEDANPSWLKVMQDLDRLASL